MTRKQRNLNKYGTTPAAIFARVILADWRTLPPAHRRTVAAHWSGFVASGSWNATTAEICADLARRLGRDGSGPILAPIVVDARETEWFRSFSENLLIQASLMEVKGERATGRAARLAAAVLLQVVDYAESHP